MMPLTIPPGVGEAQPPTQATTGAPAPGGWLQELETQAHALSWFQDALGWRSCVARATHMPAPGQDPGRVEAVPSPLPCTVPAEGPVMEPPSDAQPASSAGSASRPAPAITPEFAAAPSSPTGVPASSCLAPGADVARGSARRAAPLEAAFASAASKQPAEPAAPVRVHVEQGASGLLVWIGVDGDAATAAARSAAILAQLRGAAALPLAAVVCNGNLVYAAAAPRSPFDPDQEASWR
jgi:hypothetical protein